MRQIFVAVAMLVLLSCSGGNGGAGTDHCLLAGAPATADTNCCNGMKPTDHGSGYLACAMPSGGPCYNPDAPNVVVRETCIGGPTAEGTVAPFPSGACTSDSDCRLGDYCFHDIVQWSCAPKCMNAGNEPGSGFACCQGLEVGAKGNCGLPAGHLCNENYECASGNCVPGSTIATCDGVNNGAGGGTGVGGGAGGGNGGGAGGAAGGGNGGGAGGGAGGGGGTSSIAAPTDASAFSGGGYVALSWTAVPGATGYTVNYGLAPNATGGGSLDVTSTNAVVVGLADRTQYGFTISSRDAQGTGAPSNIVFATPMAGSVIGIATGANHVCASMRDGGVRCAGDNSHGQLGDRSLRSWSVAVPVSGASAGFMAAGVAHTCTLTNPVCWGANDDGQLGSGTQTYAEAPVSPQLSGYPVSEVAAGGHVSCFRRTVDNAVVCAGQGSSVPTEVAQLHGSQLIAASANNVCGVVDGGIVCTSATAASGVSAPSGSPRSLKVGLAHGCMQTFLINGGGELLHCWGENAFGQVGDGTTNPALTPVKPNLASASEISLGDNHSCAIAGATAWCWGDNRVGQVGQPAADAGGADFYPSPTLVDAGRYFAISASGDHTCAASTDGGVLCWGNGVFRPTPVAGF